MVGYGGAYGYAGGSYGYAPGGFPSIVSNQSWSDLTAFDYYVDPVSGSNANPGTLASPYQTIAAAAANGNSVTIGLKRGTTHSGAVSLVSQTLGAYGSGAKPILTHNSNATISASGSCRLQNLDTRSTATSATIAAVTVGGASLIQGCAMSSNDNKCLTLSACNGAIVEDCTFTDAVACAQLCTLFQSVNCIVRRCTFNRTQTGSSNGVYVHGTGSTGHIIEWCDVYSSVADTSGTVISGVNVYFDFTSVDPIIVRFNRIRGNWDRYVFGQRNTIVYGNLIDCRSSLANNIGITSTRGSTVTARANTILIDTNTIYGMLADNTTSGSTLNSTNNIIHATSGSPFYYGNSGSTIVANYNCYNGSLRASPFLASNFATWQAGGQDTNGILDDPEFVSIGTGDLSLGQASPARRTGLRVTDYDYRVLLAQTTYGTSGIATRESVVNIGAMA